MTKPGRLPFTVGVEAALEAPRRYLVQLTDNFFTVIVGEHYKDDDAVDHARELAILNGWTLVFTRLK